MIIKEHRGKRGWWMILPALMGLAALDSTPAASQEVWLGPLEPRAPHTHITGALDWTAIFRPDAPWVTAASNTQIFHVNPAYIADAPDEQLGKLKAAMAARHIDIGISLQAVAASAADKCGATEGYDDLRVVTAVVAKLQRLGIQPKYIGMDGPVWFGHYAQGPQECHFAIEDVAARTTSLVRLYLDAFPLATLGDIEGIPALGLQPDWQANYRIFKTILERDTGHKITYLQLDVSWRDPGWPDHMAAMAAFTKTEGMKLGVIYNGDAQDRDDAAWTAHAKHNFEVVESGIGIMPDQAVFVSWNQFPRYALPETSPTAHTWLINQYRLPRTQFAFDPRSETISGSLLNAQGAGIPNAAVQASILGMDLSQPPRINTAAGVVPAGARSAIMGLRVNMECFCSGDNDLIIGDFTYAETQNGSVSQAFRYPSLAAKGPRLLTGGVQVRPTVIEAGLFVRLTVPAGQPYGYLSQIFAVTPGANFEFDAPIGSITGKGMFGTATVIWLDAAGKGIQRTNINLEQDVRATQTLTTDAAGRFTINGPTGSAASAVRYRLSYDGTPSLRGAYADTP